MFVKNNESFTCIHCGKYVPLHKTSSRDHCIFCLYGLHVDIFPGDRKNPCKGLLIPIDIDIRNGKAKICYRCETCHKEVSNSVAEDDDKEAIVMLSSL